jgi:hypothetical protein
VTPETPVLAASLVVYSGLELAKCRMKWALPLFDPSPASKEPYRPIVNNELHELWLPLALSLGLAIAKPAFALVPLLHAVLFWRIVEVRGREVLVIVRQVLGQAPGR